MGRSRQVTVTMTAAQARWLARAAERLLSEGTHVLLPGSERGALINGRKALLAVLEEAKQSDKQLWHGSPPSFKKT